MDNREPHDFARTIAYALTCPVITSVEGRLASVRYAAAIEQGYRDALHAAPGYTGLITKTTTLTAPIKEAPQVRSLVDDGRG